MKSFPIVVLVASLLLSSCKHVEQNGLDSSSPESRKSIEFVHFADSFQHIASDYYKGFGTLDVYKIVVLESSCIDSSSLLLTASLNMESINENYTVLSSDSAEFGRYYLCIHKSPLLNGIAVAKRDTPSGILDVCAKQITSYRDGTMKTRACVGERK